MKKVLKTIGDIILTIFVIFEVGILVTVLVTRLKGETPSIFGYTVNVIATPSMEDKLHVGDVIISKNYNSKKDTLKVNDIISYQGKVGDYNGKLITHQIIDIEDVGYDLLITTQGIANKAADPLIHEEQVVSVFKYRTLLLTFLYSLIKKPVGFVLLVIVPIVAIMVGETITLVKSNSEEKKHDEKLIQ